MQWTGNLGQHFWVSGIVAVLSMVLSLALSLQYDLAIGTVLTGILSFIYFSGMLRTSLAKL